MEIGVISVRYARALLKYSIEAGLEQEVYKDMSFLAESYARVSQLKSTMKNPMLSNDQKESLIVTACGDKISDATRRFVHLVLNEDRGGILHFIANSYITLYRKQKNVIRGRLITAAAVSSDTQQKMRQMVEKKTKGTVEFDTQVQPEILGGFILEYDTYRMDASVKTQIRTILEQLKK